MSDQRTPQQVEDAMLEDEMREDEARLAPLRTAFEKAKTALDGLQAAIEDLERREAETRQVAEEDHIELDGRVD